LIWNDEFTAGTIKGQKYGSQAFAGIIAGAYAEVNHGLDREDYLLVQLSYGDSLNLNLQSKGNLRLTLKGPMQAGTESIPTTNVWTGNGDAKALSLGYSAKDAAHTLGLSNADSLGKPLRYWVLIESIKDQQEPIPYILKVNRVNKK
jgi:hypothetical protein